MLAWRARMSAGRNSSDRLPPRLIRFQRRRPLQLLSLACVFVAVSFGSASLLAQDNSNTAAAPRPVTPQQSPAQENSTMAPAGTSQQAQPGQQSEKPSITEPPAPDPGELQGRPRTPIRPPAPLAPPSTSYTWLKIVVACALAFCVGFVLGRATAPVPKPTVEARVAEVANAPGAQVSFQHRHSDLRDLYNEIWHAAEDEQEQNKERIRILALWRERLGAMEGSDGQGLAQAWNLIESYKDAAERDKAKIWLGALEKWGLTRLHPTQIDVDERTLRHFVVSPRGARRAVVTEPCWVYAGKILQKGRATTDSARA
jgi:hypothetical protein